MSVLVWVSSLLCVQAQYIADLYEPQIPTFTSQNPYYYDIPQFYLNDYYQPQYFAYNVQRQFHGEVNENIGDKGLNNVNQTETADYGLENQADINSILKKFQLPKISALPSNNYRGFGYQTKYGEGASSTVVFFTGPSVYSKENILKHITVASDSLDPQVPQLEQRLSNIFKNQPNGAQSENTQLLFPYPFVRTLIENSPLLSNIFRFYNEPTHDSNVGQSRNLNVEQVPKINNSTDHPIHTTLADETNKTTLLTTIQPITDYTSQLTTTESYSTTPENTTAEKN
ncbi:uncharacterized protein LOC143197694 [Rhynchophorus ferrugineus]|uniref:uncharacterized protein LOC143197694 n=1 Tax=Rhynchophorus ferrugineus TaxID=354439 RepID=UPI003FCE015B